MKTTEYQRSGLIIKAFGRFIISLFILAIILFIPAGTYKYWNAWWFILELYIPMFCVLIYLLIFDPELLHKRLKSKEKESTQKNVVLLGSLSILSGLVLSGLDFRFNWFNMPVWLVIVSSVFVLLGYILFFIVMKQNSYASRVVEIQEKQKIIDTGVYAMVRHPMYLAAILIFTFMPLVLGSFIALIPLTIFPVLLCVRIKNEEEIMEKGLDGYTEYKKKVKYKIIPFLF